MSRLFFDLELHGFHVLSDLHLGETQPSNWVQWYITRISHCNFVVFVCSPAFKKLFEETVQVDRLPNPKAKHLVNYRNAVYAGISKEMSKEGRKKFIPVILDDNYMRSAQREESVPVLFQPGTVYCVTKEEQKRSFDFDNKSRDFEKLVCHMAGINRDALEKKNMRPQVAMLPQPFQPSKQTVYSLKGRLQNNMAFNLQSFKGCQHICYLIYTNSHYMYYFLL